MLAVKTDTFFVPVSLFFFLIIWFRYCDHKQWKEREGVDSENEQNIQFYESLCESFMNVKTEL